VFDGIKRYFSKPEVQKETLADSYVTKSSTALPEYVADYESGGKKPSVSSYYTTYGTSDLVNSCVNYISETAGMTKFVIGQKDTSGRLVPLKNKKVRELFDSAPNQYFTWQELIEQMVQSYLLTGNSYLSFEPIESYELWQLETEKMQVVPDSKDYLKGYLYNDKVAFDPVDVLHLRRASSSNQYYGTSAVMDCLVDPLLLEAYGITDLKSFYENSSVGSGVLSSEFPLTKAQIDSVREQFEKAYGTGGKRHSAIILPNKMSYTSVKLSPKDSMLLDSLKISDDRVLRVFRLHKMLLGGDVPSYSTKTEDVAKLCFNTAIKPITEKIASQLQLFFRRFLNTQNLFVIADYDRIPYISDTIAEKAEHITKLIASGTISWNEGRDILGMAQLENTNYNLRFVPSYLLGSNPIAIDDYKPGMVISPVNGITPEPTTVDPNGGNNATPSAR